MEEIVSVLIINSLYCLGVERNNIGITLVELKKQNIMSNLFYLIAVLLIIGWAIGFFAYSLTGIIHILLVLAVLSVLFRLISGRSV